MIGRNSQADLWLMQAEIQEAVETIVRKHISGWKSVHFDKFPIPHMHYDERAKTIDVSIDFRARELGTDIVGRDLGPKHLKIEFLNP